jgi:hypothetical protein
MFWVVRKRKTGRRIITRRFASLMSMRSEAAPQLRLNSPVQASAHLVVNELADSDDQNQMEKPMTAFGLSEEQNPGDGVSNDAGQQLHDGSVVAKNAARIADAAANAPQETDHEEKEIAHIAFP